MRTLIAIVLLVALALSGCSGNPSNINSNSSANANEPTIKPNPDPPVSVSPPDPTYASCNAYYPLKPGSKLTYTLAYPTGLSVIATVVVDEIQENGRKVYVEKTHLKDAQTNGIELLQNQERRYVCNGERIIIISDRTVTAAKENRSIATSNYGPDTVFIPDNASFARQGFTWTISFTQTMQTEGQMPTVNNDPTVLTLQIVGDEEVTTKAGKFKAVKVKRNSNIAEIYEYYVRGVGMVKRMSNQGLTWELATYQGVSPEQAP